MLKLIGQTILNFFGAILALIQFLVNTITGLIKFLFNIPNYLTIIIQCSSLLPTWVIPYSIAFVSISAFMFLVLRKGVKE